MVVVLMTAIGLAIHFLRGEIATIYTDDAAVTAAALPALAVLSFLIIFDGLQGVLVGALRGAADVILPTAELRARLLGLRRPALLLSGLPAGLAARWAWPGAWWRG